MKLIIAGSRTLGSLDLEAAIKALDFNRRFIKEVVCGCAEGIDRVGYEYARQYQIPVVFFPAWPHQHEWAFFKKKPEELIVYPKGGYSGYSATYGYQRNEAMAEYADALLSAWDGESKGSKHMRAVAEWAGLRTYYHNIELPRNFKRPVGRPRKEETV